MLKYFIGLRATRLDDHGDVNAHSSVIRYTSDKIMTVRLLASMARNDLNTYYPTSARWYARQYTLDGKEWHDA